MADDDGYGVAAMFLRLWKEGDTGLEVAAKAGAALGAAALGTAFLFDGVYFWQMDARLLGTFVLADHVETAVYCIPLLLMFAAVLLIVPAFALLLRMAHDAIERRFGQTGNFIAAIAVSAVVLVGYSCYFAGRPAAPPQPPAAPSTSTNLLFAYMAVVVGVMVGGGSLWMFLARDSSLGAASRRLTWQAPVVWIASTILFAMGVADENVRDLTSNKATFEDVVVLQDYTQLAGRLIKLIDKGAIIGIRGPATFAFIPKERIARVDLGVKRTP